VTAVGIILNSRTSSHFSLKNALFLNKKLRRQNI
jgi:hypothetical protein